MAGSGPARQAASDGSPPGALPDVQRAFAAMGEPTRYRILEVLAESAATVGGVAEAVGALQPQTTKHLQTLEGAGLITVHRLGRRRVASLKRASFAALSAHLDGWAQAHPDDEALQTYGQAIAREQAGPGRDRTVSLRAVVPGSLDAVWRAWTDPQIAGRWWAPPHFEVRELTIAPRPGAPIRFVLGEPGGEAYRSEGGVLEAEPGRRLVFALAPVDGTGAPMFDAVHTVALSGDELETTVELCIEARNVRPDAVEAIAGLEPGWEQLLTALAALFAEGSARS